MSEKAITRRRLMTAARHVSNRRADVVVVGAGLAGLTAAREVAGAGRSVVVLEARDHVGGRLKNWRCSPQTTCDCGQLVSPHFTRIRALAKELGIALYTPYRHGNDVFYRDGVRLTPPASGALGSPNLAPLLAPDEITAILQLDQMAATVPPDAPWRAPRAAEWDSQTVESFKQQATLTPVARFVVDALVYVVAAAEPGEVSLLHFLGLIAAYGDGRRPGTVQHAIFDLLFASDFVDGGIQRIPLEMARQLGRSVVLGAPVRRLTQRRGRVIAESDRLRVVAKRAIVALPPSLTGWIAYDPPLPGARAQLSQRFPQGSITTFAAAYETPFWRAAGLSGRGLGLDPVLFALDVTPPRTRVGVLTAVLFGEAQRRHAHKPAGERKRVVLENLATYFGKQALEPVMTLERQWSGGPADAPWVDADLAAQWTRGCPGYLPPGVLLDYGRAIRETFERVHWAGTEHSTSFPAAHEGALRSGEATAKEVLNR